MNDIRPQRNSLEPSPLNRSSPLAKRLMLLAIALAAGALLFWGLKDYLSLDYLANREAELRSWQIDYPVVTMFAALAIYVTVAGLSLPGAAALTLVLGWYFGFWKALVIVSFGSTGGATVAFLLSRYLLRDWIQSRMQLRFSGINEAFEREGAFYLFTLRLIPAIPFFAINTLMGLTTIRTATFWWVSQLGMLPGTAAYVYAGSSVPDLQTLASEGAGQVLSWQLFVAFGVLGVLPLAMKRVLAFFSRKATEPDADAAANSRKN